MIYKLLIVFLLCCSFANFATAQKALDKGYLAIPPTDLVGKELDGLLEGTVNLKSGRELKWTLFYDKVQNKPWYMLFDCPDDVKQEDFYPVIQAMTIREFWNGIGTCLMASTNDASIHCIITLQSVALTDCIRTESKTDCWMINR